MSLLSSPLSIPIIAIGGAFGFVIIQTIVSSVMEIVKHRNEIELKQSMIDRGMSADEIERIMRATPQGGGKC